MLNSDPLPYKPAAYLLARSLLTEEQISAQFEEFKASLDYMTVAPQLVFERMLSNVNESILAKLEGERRESAAAMQAHETKNKVLETSVAELLDKAKTQESERREEMVLMQAYETRNKVLETSVAQLLDKVKTLESRNITPDETPEPAPNFWTQISRSMVSSNIDWMRLQVTAFLKFGFETTPWQVSSKAQVPRGHFTKLSDAGTSWLDITSSDWQPDFRHGTFMTLDTHFNGSLRFENAFVVTFETPFMAPPKVVVWLGGIEMHMNEAWRVKTYSSDVTKTGFILHIDSWDGSMVLTAGVAWVAFPGDDESICTGRLDTWEPPSWKSSTLREDGRVTYEYPSGNDGPHRQLLLIDTIEVENAAGLSLALGFGPEETVGSFNWRMTAGPPEARLYSVGATYMVMTKGRN
ncbi:hypothetical protein Q9L58_006099 [Maublancomyces gigas]|uniref:H-type lectin domain-containing protein n=1 Tax=Discina gigas TaxID=1032678 RepID=A0ABR3GGK5_9PEZI